MPLLAPGGNAQIVLDAYVDKTDFDAKVASIETRLDRARDGLVAQSNQISSAARQSTMSWTDFRSMYSTVLDVVRVGQQIWNETGGKFVEYADNVRDVSRALGTTSEEASRLIQVSDDVFISVDTLKTAFKNAQKDGISPTVEGLAQLSDQYLALQPGVERTQFLLDKFGKTGGEMGKLMEKGGDGIRKASAAIDENLILTQQGTDAALKYKEAQDQLSDTVDGLEIAIGSHLTPVLSDAIKIITADITAIFTFGDALKEMRDAARDSVNPFEKISATWEALADWAAKIVNSTLPSFMQSTATTTQDAANASADATGQFESEAEMTKRLADEAKATAEALKEITEVNRGIIGTIDDLTKIEETYQSTKEKLAAERAQIAADDLKALDENTKKVQENEDAYAKANLEIISGLVERKLMQDGVLTDDEFNWLIEKREAWGLYSADVVEKAKAAWEEADKITASVEAIPEEKTVDVIINTLTGSGSAGGIDSSTGIIDSTLGGVLGGWLGGFAKGGSFQIPMAYGNEGFRLGNMATASGGETVTVSPKGQGVNNNTDLIAAIAANRIDERSLARSIVSAMKQAGAG